MKTLLVIFPIFLAGCSSLDLRNPLQAMALTGAAGAAAGYSLSPNSESRAWNAGIFGAAAGLVGYLAMKFIFPKPPESTNDLPLEKKPAFRPLQELNVPPSDQKLPRFVEQRLTPLVLEEWEEKDSISEDGSLREPHRVWRIKKYPELGPLPAEAPRP